MKSGSGLSACRERRASTWQRSSAQIPRCFLSPPVCLSTGSFNAANHSTVPAFRTKHYSRQSFDIHIHTNSETKCAFFLPDLSHNTMSFVIHIKVSHYWTTSWTRNNQSVGFMWLLLDSRLCSINFDGIKDSVKLAICNLPQYLESTQ